MRSFDISQEDIVVLSNSSKEFKFSTSGNNFIYPKNIDEVVTAFLQSYRFLTHIANQIDENTLTGQSQDDGSPKNSDQIKGISKKIKRILDSYRTHYEFFNIYGYKIETPISWGTHRSKNRIKKYLDKNSGKVMRLIDFVFAIGRTIKSVNPSEMQGYY